jgi:hypothetical protein
MDKESLEKLLIQINLAEEALRGLQSYPNLGLAWGRILLAENFLRQSRHLVRRKLLGIEGDGCGENK